MMKPRVLVIDDVYGDSSDLAEDFVRVVDPAGRCAFAFCSGQVDCRNSIPKVLEAVEQGWPLRSSGGWALVLLDVQFSQRPIGHADARWGFEVLSALRARWPDLPVVMLTSQENAKTQANWADADGFLPKPSARDRSSPQDFLRRLYAFGLFPDLRTGSRLAGSSVAMLRVLQEARRFASDPLGSGRILYGETGTGKTELARFIHEEMVDRSGPFHSWSAAGADEGVTKSALFGHWKGAFTGSTDDSAPGAIERSHGGTFFLDEVASLSPAAQALFIETRRRDEQLRRRISRMGKFPTSPKDKQQALESVVPPRDHLKPDHRIAVDVVMLTASNLNLHDEDVADALGFRRDLLNDLGAPIYLPPLNERRQDIPEIFEEIVGHIGAHLGRSKKHVDERVLSDLMARDWTKKNVVALRQIAEHAVIASRDFDEILVRHLPPPVETRRWAGDRPRRVDSAAQVAVGLPPAVPAAPTITELVALIQSFDVPAESSGLEGALPTLQRAYASLILRLLGGALRATKDHRGETSSLQAVRHLLGLQELRKNPQSYAAYDIVLRIAALCDAGFEGLPVEDCELLSDDVEVRERVKQAIAKRRKSSRNQGDQTE